MRAGWLLVFPMLLVGRTAGAVTVPFEETFSTDNANWTNLVEAPLTWVASGGVDGGGYVTQTIALIENPGTIVFQARPADDASGDAFEGNWKDFAGGDNVAELSAWVRHDGPAPISFFFRITCCDANSPAAIGIVPIPVLPDTWTQISVDINVENALLFPEFGDLFTILSDVENLQIGAIAPSGLAGVPFTFDLDQVSVVPEPGTAALLGLGLGLAGMVVSRRRAPGA